MTFVYFIIVLGVLVLLHELGHFIAAKRAGIKVEEFSFGFGPKIFGFKRGETEYKISILPLGGYVKMTGEDPEEEPTNDPRAFCNQSLFNRFKVVVCGPLMNLVLALAVMPIVFMIGRSEPAFFSEPPMIKDVRAQSPADQAGLKNNDMVKAVNGKSVATWKDLLEQMTFSIGRSADLKIERNGEVMEKKLAVQELAGMQGGFTGIEPYLFAGNEARFDSIASSSPAQKAGLKRGDLVLAINGITIVDWVDFAQTIQKIKGDEFELTYQRDNEKLETKLKPEYNDTHKRWLIGVSKDSLKNVEMVKKRYSFFEAVYYGTLENVRMAGITLVVLKKIVTMDISFKMIGGPVMIAKASAVAAATGIAAFLYFLTFVSIQLGILNLLPIPVLDGGHLLFFTIEWLRKKPINKKIQIAAMKVGWTFLILLMVVVTFNDVNRLWNVVGFVKKIF